MKKDKNKFTKEEVIKLIRFYLEQQRIVCQLPVSSSDGKFITKEQFEKICKTIKFDCNIENTGMAMAHENFSERLSKL